MGVFHVDAALRGIGGRRKPAVVRGLLVDSGSEFSWVPETFLRAAGVTIAKKDLAFLMADGRQVTRSTGYAIVHVGDFETVDEVVFGQPGDLALLGARALDGFGATVDARRRRLVAAGPHVAAPGCERP